MSDKTALQALPLPEEITSRQVQTGPAGLSFHILEAGNEPSTPPKPLIILLHGFPELAFSWRRVMPLLAQAGFYVVAPDQRGYGRTTGWDTRGHSNVDLRDFSLLDLVRDVVLLTHAVGYTSVKCIVGHDFGAVAASLCALTRPDFFQSLVLLSHPFKGTPNLFDTVKSSSSGAQSKGSKEDIHRQLADLGRKHYKIYYSTQPANEEMTNPPQGLHDFLRGYFHLKSASWAGNQPHPLKEWSASELAKMPYYYIMPLDATMPQAIAQDMAQEPISSLQHSLSWLPDSALAVYTAEYARTGFQGGLNWYRVSTTPGAEPLRILDVLAGKKIEVPCVFISGRQDWGMYQEPGVVDKMESGETCTDYRGTTLIDGAGHWAPQEKPDDVAKGILDLVRSLG